MLNAERLARLRTLAEEKGFLTIREIMQEFGVSRSSAMRDLDELERQGVVVRQRGGAILKGREAGLTRTNEPATPEKADIHTEEKRQAARKAAEQIREGECLFLDSGSTVGELIPYLQDKNVTIVTPSLYLIQRMPESFPGRICLLGGDYDQAYQMCSGPLARQILQAFHFDLAVISANGIADEKAWSNDPGVAEIKREAMVRADRVLLLADSSKEKQRGMYEFASFGDFDEVVTERDKNEDE